MSNFREVAEQPIHLIRIEDGTILLGPFPQKPRGDDPFITVETSEGTLWVKHSRRWPTAEQLRMIGDWAARLVEHRVDTPMTGAIGLLSAEIRSDNESLSSEDH